jgi:LuxR family maltose regulon positive regulatory protein
VSRPRLIRQLDAGLKGKLTLISTPAGYGKTTLLSVWLGEVDQRKAWISLDQGDNDPASFLSYLVSALQIIDPEIGVDIPDITHSPQPPPIQTMLVGIINDITDLSEQIVLVLDDYHLITNTDVQDAVSMLIQNLPPQMHIVIATRADPPWPLARLRVRNEMNELRMHDLRFTHDEVKTYMQDVLEIELTRDEIDALNIRTEGWIASLQMAALSIKGHQDASSYIQSITGSHRYILDFLVEEVLDNLDAEMKEFLLKTSILDRLSPSLCDGITGKGDGLEMLAKIEAKNLFLVPLDDERIWYRYHHLFADLLQQQLGDTLPDEVSGLHKRASDWFEDNGLVENAVSHALISQDLSRAANLIENHSLHMIIQSKLTTLSWWFEALPKQMIRCRPRLCVYHAWTQYWTGKREGGDECLEYAEKIMETGSTPTECDEHIKDAIKLTEDERELIAGHIAAIRSYYALTNEDIPLVMEMSQKAIQLLPEDDYMRCLAGLTLGGAYWSLGNVTASETAHLNAAIAARDYDYRLLAVSAYCYTGHQQLKQAQLHKAHKTYNQALKLARGPSGRFLPGAGFPSLKLADLHCEWNELETAKKFAETGVSFCEQWGQADILSEAYVVQASLQLALGHTNDAFETIQKAHYLVEHMKIDPWIRCWLDECNIRYWIMNNDIRSAKLWAESSGLTIEGELSFIHDLHHLNLARVLLARGMHIRSNEILKDATLLLDRIQQTAEEVGWTHHAIKSLVLKAIAHQEIGDDQTALETLIKAMTLGEPGGYVRTFINEGVPMRDLLTQAIAKGDGGEYTSRLLEHLHSDSQAVEKEKTSPRELLVEPLSDREIEILRLLTTHLSTPEIADELYIATSTVRSHIKNIYSKLNVHRRLDAVDHAKELGLI